MLSPPPTFHSPTSSTSPDIYSACRSLQSLITTSIPSPTSYTSRPSRNPPQLASPIALRSTRHASPHSKPSQKIATPQTPPRPSKKRRRSLSDADDDDDDSPSHDQENLTPSKPSTPKRQRLYPPSLPLGLEPADFDALQQQAANIPIPLTPDNPPQNQHQPTPPPPQPLPNCPSPDDSALISLILRKLNLRQSDWDECALRLGKGKDSIGERWKLLLGGDGEVGLRRGYRALRRGSVQRMEFGGPLRRV